MFYRVIKVSFICVICFAAPLFSAQQHPIPLISFADLLQGEGSSHRLPIAPTPLYSWLGYTDRLYFKVPNETGLFTHYILDLNQSTLTKLGAAPDVVQNVVITDQYERRVLLQSARKSPSGRYLAYPSQTSTLLLYDKHTKSTRDTGIVLFSGAQAFAPYELIWSANEQILSVRQIDQFGPHLNNAVYLESNGSIRKLLSTTFLTNSGENLTTEDIEVTPTEQGLAVVRSDSRFWLLDMKARKGIQITQFFFGAALSSDGATLYLAQKEGIYRYKIDDLINGELISDNISGRWTGLNRVLFSPTLNYAIAITDNDEAWSYQLPKH